MDQGEPAARSLLEQGLQALRDLLGEGWTVARRLAVAPEADLTADAVVDLRSPDDSVRTELLVELKSRITPRLVNEVIAPHLALLRRVDADMNVLVMAPWISPRVQKMLRDSGIGYLDLTGNVSVRFLTAAIVIRTEGASREPRAAVDRDTHRTTLAGPRAGRLVRVLADFAPPYRATQIAQTADVSRPWVSKLLSLLEEQLLIRRDGQVITEVDWPNLLRARAETFEILRHNSYVGMIAPNGVAHVLDALRFQSPPDSDGERLVVTGSYAARAVAPLSVGGQLMLYADAGPHSPDMVGDRLGLLRVAEKQNADVLLLRAYDDVVFQRWRAVNGTYYVALSQLVVDCLAGPGRMPAEGEAVLDYMKDAEALWRLKNLPFA